MKLIKSFFILFSSLALIGLTTNAYFSDTETSSGNQFQANTWEAGHVVINEVYYNVATDKKGEPTESKYEWVELYNPTNQTINLQGWKIYDSNDYDQINPKIDLDPGEFLILSHDASILQLYWSLPTGTKTVNLGGPIGNGLANDNGMLILKDAQGNVIDQMSWGTPNPSWANFNSNLWTLGTTSPNGSSLERQLAGTDTDTAADFVERSPPTPGL